MKKNFLKFAVVAVMFAFAACSSDDGGSKNNGGANGNTEECTGLKAAADAAITAYNANTISCDAALDAIVAAWEAECYSYNEAIAKANPLPCFDTNDFN